MSFLFNPKPPRHGYANLSADLASNRGNQRILFGSNTSYPNFVDDPDFRISSKHIQTHVPSLAVEPKMGSVHTTDNFSHFNTCFSASKWQPVSLDGSAENSLSWYSTIPLDGPRSSYLLYQESQVHSFPDLPSFHPSELVSDYPDLYTPISSLAYSNDQYLRNQAVFHESNNYDIRGKPVPSIFDNQPCPEITHQSSLIRNQTIDVMRLGSKIHSSCLTDYASNNDAVLHRSNQESVSLVSHDHFTEQNEKKGGLPRTMVTLAHVTKRKASEEGNEQQEWKRRRNLHQCKSCNMSFSTGNALGGHMSYHAKQKKLEAKKIALMSMRPHDSDVAFTCALASGLQGSVYPFMDTFRW